jgi:S-adenosylmethionine:tRNA ribosyltransferase-isomerase
VLEAIKARNISTETVCLHVGAGTFLPVKSSLVSEHTMHREPFVVTLSLLEKLLESKGKVIAVGTTSCRVLESIAQKGVDLLPCEGDTEIFIYPGYEFKILDGLITNFHLPESTLIMLVAALAGYDNIMNAYKTAVDEKYRFFSFGDCCFFC